MALVSKVDPYAQEDDLWLQDRVVALLQSYIEPSIWSDRGHIEDMERARRCLLRLKVRPITFETDFERAVRAREVANEDCRTVLGENAAINMAARRRAMEL